MNFNKSDEEILRKFYKENPDKAKSQRLIDALIGAPAAFGSYHLINKFSPQLERNIKFPLVAGIGVLASAYNNVNYHKSVLDSIKPGPRNLFDSLQIAFEN